MTPARAAAALLLLAGPARAASLFLATEHPFLPDAPGAVVKLEVRGARAVDVRLYRLSDPERSLLEEHAGSPEASGRKAPSRRAGERRTPGPLGLLREALSGAAQDARRAADRGLSPQARLLLSSAARGPRRSPPSALPFLSDLELVERWDLACGALDADHGYCDLEIGPRPAGAYLVEAAAGGEVVQAVALFSTLAATARRIGDQLVALAVDSRTGQPADGVAFSLFAPGEPTVRGGAGRAGLFTARLGDAPASLLARRGKDLAVVEVGAQSPAEPEARALLVTDRGEYRPGEVVRYHGFARTGEEPPGLPRAERIEVAAYDARGSLFQRSRRPVSAQGGFSGEVALARELPQGLYRLVATLDGRPAGADFSVRRAPEPAFDLAARLSLARAGARGDGELRASLEGRPVRGALVRWRALRYPLDAEGASSPEEVDRGEVETDEAGRASLSFASPPLDGRYELSLLARDPAGRLALGSASAVALRAPLRATLVAERRVVPPGAAATLQIRAFGEGGLPVAAELKVRVLAAHGGAAGAEGPREPVQALSVRTGADGAGTFTFVAKATGYYEVELARGEVRLDETFLFVTVDGGDIPFSPDTLTLVPDKASYAVGELARVLVLSPFDAASALVTVEGRELVRAEALAIRGASAIFRIRVTPALAPGFTVAAQAIFGERSYRRERRIPVQPAGEALEVRAALKAEGGRGELSVEVADRVGRPVAGAEVFATVLDARAVPPSAPPTLAFFYPLRPSSAQAASSTGWRSSDAGRPRASGALDGSEEGALPFKGLSQGRPRPRDAGSLLSAAAVTDAGGRASFAFAAPPTAPRLLAQVRAAAGPAFGEWGQTLDRALPAAELRAPRFLRRGDRALVRAILEASPPQEVALEAPGGAARGAPAAQLLVEGAGEAVALTAWFGALGEVQGAVPVLPPDGRRSGESGVLAAGRSLALPPPGPAAEGARLFLSADPAAAALAARGSRAGPDSATTPSAVWRVLARVAARRSGQTSGSADGAGAAADVAALVGIAHPEGAFGAYDGAAPSAELSAEAVLALALARDEGLEVEGGILARGAARLCAGPGRGALALWACALGDAAAGAAGAVQEELAEDRGRGLSVSERALLALSLHELGEDAEASEVARRLEKALRAAGALACAGERCLDEGAPRSSLAASALAALALEAALPRSAVLAPLARYLLSRRGAGDFGADFAGGLAALAVAGARGALPPGKASASVEARGARPAALALVGPVEQEVDLRQASAVTAVGGPLYWRLERPARPPDGGADALLVQRELRPLGDSGAPEDRPVRVGDRVQVTLRLRTGRATGPVEVTDPYPAGLAPFEVDGEREAFRQLDARARRTFGEDRLTFLLPALKPGETILQWEAVARIAGEFGAPPALARSGELVGQSAPASLRIEAAP